MQYVLKYGGSSLSTIKKIKQIAQLLKHRKELGHMLVVVVSAMGKTTNRLISLSHYLSKSPNDRELDALMSVGENISASLLSIALNEIGCDAISLSGRQAGIKTTDAYNRAFIRHINPKRIKKELNNNRIVIVTGFQGIDSRQNITTLGRGGSDTTAVALAGALKFDCEIYTDVNGVFSIDPRLIPNAKKLSIISYDEMMELAVAGAKILDTRCIELAKKYKVNLYIGESMEKNKTGTYVVKGSKSFFEKVLITGIATKDDFSTISITTKDKKGISFLSALLAKLNIPCEMLSYKQIEDIFYTSLSAPSETVNAIYRHIKQNQLLKLCNISITDAEVKLSIIGTGFATHSILVNSILQTLDEENINYKRLILFETVMSFIVNKNDKIKAISALSKKLNLEEAHYEK